MADPNSFGEWLRQNQGGAAAGPSFKTPKPYGFGASASGAAQTPLEWLVDIVSRPLYGSMNAIQSSVNRAVDADVKGDLSIHNPFNPIGDFATGMFSTDPANHRYFSDVLEQSTDKIGGAYDKNYVNKENNVPDIVRGTVGFAGDVLFDPLTYLPVVGWAGKGVSLGAKGLKAGADKFGAASKAGEAVGKVATGAGKAGTGIQKAGGFLDLFPNGKKPTAQSVAGLIGGTAAAAPLAYAGQKIGAGPEGDNQTGAVVGGLGGGLLGFLVGGAAGAKIASKFASRDGAKVADNALEMAGRNDEPAAQPLLDELSASPAAPVDLTAESLSKLKVADVRAQAKALGLRGYSKQSKTVLVQRIVERQTRQAAIPKASDMLARRAGQAAGESDALMLSPERGQRLSELSAQVEDGARLSKAEFDEYQALLRQAQNMKKVGQIETGVDSVLGSWRGEQLQRIFPELESLQGLGPAARSAKLGELTQASTAQRGTLQGVGAEASAALQGSFTNSGTRASQALIDAAWENRPVTHIREAVKGLPTETEKSGFTPEMQARIDTLQSRFSKGQTLTLDENRELTALQQAKREAGTAAEFTPEEVIREYGRRLWGTNALGEDGLRAAQQSILAVIDSYVSTMSKVSSIDASAGGRTAFPFDGIVTVPVLNVTEAESRALRLAMGIQELRRGGGEGALSALVGDGAPQRAGSDVISDMLEAGLTREAELRGAEYVQVMPPKQVVDAVLLKRREVLDRGRAQIEEAIQLLPKNRRGGLSEEMLRQELEAAYLRARFNEADAYLKAMIDFATSASASAYLNVQHVLGPLWGRLRNRSVSTAEADALIDGIRRVLRGGVADPLEDRATRTLGQELGSAQARAAYGSDTPEQAAANLRRGLVERDAEAEAQLGRTSRDDSAETFRQDPERATDVEEARRIATEGLEGDALESALAQFEAARFADAAKDVEAWAIQRRLIRYASMFHDIGTYQDLLVRNAGFVEVLQALGVNPVNDIIKNYERHSRVATPPLVAPAKTLETIVENPEKAVQRAQRQLVSDGALGMDDATVLRANRVFRAIKYAFGGSAGATLRNLVKNQWATHAQSTLWMGKGRQNGIFTDIAEEASRLKLRGEARAEFIARELVPSLRSAEDALRDVGIRSVIDDPARVGTPLALSHGDIIESLLRIDPDLTFQAVLNHGRQLRDGKVVAEGTQVAITNLDDAVYVAVNGGDEAAIFAELTKTTTRDGGPLGNMLVPGNRGTYLTKKGNYSTLQATDLARRLARLLRQAAPGFKKASDLNLADDLRLAHEEYADIQANVAGTLLREMFQTTGELDVNGLPVLRQEPVTDIWGEPVPGPDGAPLMQAVPNPNAQEGRVYAALAKAGKQVEDLALQGGAMPESVEAVLAGIDDALPTGVRRSAEQAEAVIEARTRAPRAKTGAEAVRNQHSAAKATRQKRSDQDAQDMIDATRPEGDEAIAAADLVGRQSGMLDGLRKKLWWKRGMELIADIPYGIGALLSWWHRSRRETIRTLVKMDPNAVKSAFNLLQSGVVESGDAAISAALPHLREFMEPFLDTGARNSEGLLGTAVFRNNTHLEALNDALKREFDGSDKYQLDLEAAHLYAAEEFRVRSMGRSKPFSAEGADRIRATAMMKHVSQQWRQWEVDNVIDFLRGLDNAASSIFFKQSIGEAFVNFARQHDFTSVEPRAGYVRLNDPGHSSVFAALPDDLYFDKELLSQLKVVEEFFDMARSPNGEIGKFIREWIDPVQNAWKTLITLPNPSHHVRNEISDIVLQLVAEGTGFMGRSLKEAAELMPLRKEYQGLDVLNAVKTIVNLDYSTTARIERTSSYPSATKVVARFKGEDITGGVILDRAFEYGLIQVAKDVEDIGMDSGKGALAYVSGRISNPDTGLLKPFGRLSEVREHHINLAHYIQIIHKAQKHGYVETGVGKREYPKNAQELLRMAAARAAKYHPNSRQLAGFEARYMRRLIPFYTWFRGIIPAVLESALNHPGRALMVPKASYNLAVAMGVDPESLADPFPEDQAFPSFLRDEGIGPQFKINGSYYMVNPGFASQSIAQIFLGSDPLHEIAAMSSPLLRIPAELITGTNVGTGSPITDMSDYIDSNVPFFGTIAGVTGRSPSSGFTQQTRNAERGNTGADDQALRAANWLLGLGVQDVSRPNYQKFAQLEEAGKTGGPKF